MPFLFVFARRAWVYFFSASQRKEIRIIPSALSAVKIKLKLTPNSALRRESWPTQEIPADRKVEVQ
jgi:hypothetical protein